uniref:Uncharacterized protein n=1 Tax=Medicago truncatula TaxID=3880 RepID=I3SBA8_MEDTR|nr:unknown [Medicago truncatula]
MICKLNKFLLMVKKGL